MSEPAIALRGVTKSFGAVPVLRGIDLELRRGEVVGFVGANGAGKTTCLRLLLGLTFRDGGDARVLGLDPDRDAVAIRRRTCYLPGETSVYQDLTGREVLRFALAHYPRLDHELERELTEHFDLPLGQRVHDYSAGMKQKLALMTALVPDVELYLLDEPDRNLDPSTQLFLLDLVRRLPECGKTVVFCSHRLGEVEVLAERLLFLLDGRILDEERIRAVRESLRSEVRVRLVEGAALPDGAEVVATDPDGCLRLRTRGEPLAWVAKLDPARVVTVEVGATHLDQVYRELTEPGGEAS